MFSIKDKFNANWGILQGNTGLPGERGETGPRVNIEWNINIKIRYK